MMTIVDARGLSCPQPVINTRKALETADAITVIVDNPIARENVGRMATSLGCTATVEEKADGIYLHIRKAPEDMKTPDASTVTEKASDTICTSGPLVILIQSDRLGRGSDDLGAVLIKSLMHTLGEISPVPDVMIFLNGGVKLTIKGSEVLDDLKGLQDKGVRILSCGTCLDYFGLSGELAVGEVSNMYDIAGTTLSAGKLVTL